MERFADFIIEKRNILLACLIAITAFFLYEAANVSVSTIYKDLLPQNHEYIKVHNEIRGRFGGANQVRIMVQVRKGGEYKDIFNTESLKKIQAITKDLLKFTAVDRYKILSIAHRKVKDFRIWTKYQLLE